MQRLVALFLLMAGIGVILNAELIRLNNHSKKSPKLIAATAPTVLPTTRPTPTPTQKPLTLRQAINEMAQSICNQEENTDYRHVHTADYDSDNKKLYVECGMPRVIKASNGTNLTYWGIAMGDYYGADLSSLK